MIRAQRRAHMRIFFALTPLLLAALIWALVQRQRADRVLRTAAIGRPIPSSRPESSP